MNTENHLSPDEVAVLEAEVFGPDDLGTPVSRWGAPPVAEAAQEVAPHQYTQVFERHLLALRFEMEVDGYIRRNQPDPSRW